MSITLEDVKAYMLDSKWSMFIEGDGFCVLRSPDRKPTAIVLDERSEADIDWLVHILWKNDKKDPYRPDAGKLTNPMSFACWIAGYATRAEEDREKLFDMLSTSSYEFRVG